MSSVKIPSNLLPNFTLPRGSWWPFFAPLPPRHFYSMMSLFWWLLLRLGELIMAFHCEMLQRAVSQFKNRLGIAVHPGPGVLIYTITAVDAQVAKKFEIIFKNVFVVFNAFMPMKTNAFPHSHPGWADCEGLFNFNSFWSFYFHPRGIFYKAIQTSSKLLKIRGKNAWRGGGSS